MNFANIMKVCLEGEDNPVLQQLRMERIMQDHEKIINRSIELKILSEINADIERILSE